MTIVGDYKRKQDMPDYQLNRNKKKNEQTKAAYHNDPEVRERERQRSKAHYEKRKLAYQLLQSNPDLVKALTLTNPDLVESLTPTNPH